MKKSITIGALAAAIIIVLAIAIISISPTGQATLADQPAARFGYRQNVAYLPFFVALENGYYDYILVKKDSGINSWQDLEGKKAGIWLGSTAKLLYTKIFKAENLDGKVEVVEIKPELLIQALESGSVDAIFLLEPDATIALEKGVGRVLDESLFAKYVMNPMPAAGAFFSTGFAKKNPGQAAKIAAAIHKAIDFINEKTKEAKKIISKYTPISEDIAVKINTEKYSKLSSAGIERFQELADLLYTGGFLDSAVDTSNMFYEIQGGLT